MDWIIQTGTDGEGNAITTTLDCQINVTWAYQQHETIDYGELTDVVRKVILTYSATDTTTGNASHLVSGQSDQTLTGTYPMDFFPSDKAVGNPNCYTKVLHGWTPHENLSQADMVKWVTDILECDSNFRLTCFKQLVCRELYGHHYDDPTG